MRKASVADLENYFRLLDAELSAPAQIVVLGGSAVSLGYISRHVTPDIDLWPTNDEAFWAAADRCKNLPGAFPISRVGITSPPLDFEDRLERVEILGLVFLTVYVPEAHDLAILKIGRGEAHDYQAVEDMHAQRALSLEVLVARYGEALTQVIGLESRFRLNFLSLVARLYGELKAQEIEPHLPRSNPTR